MTTQQLAKELNEMNEKRIAVIAANSVECNAPKQSRSFTYRKTTIIKPQDLIL